MCTVTYIPPRNKESFILTSNRDEKAFRPTIAPKIYEIEGVKVCFPKDTLAGGSWIAANNKKRLCCLLNGAFIAHKKEAFHTQSRGNILKELIVSKENTFEYFQTKILSNVEPFTIITLEQAKNKVISLSEFIWDGNKKHFKDLDKEKPMIWSSVTLYSEENRKLRINWFEKFLKINNIKITPDLVFQFHSGNHTSDISNNLIMHRDGSLKTVSITQLTSSNSQFKMDYFDLLDDKKTTIKI